MTPVAILNKEATNFKSSMDMLRIRTKILSTPELERDWENVIRRYGDYNSEDMRTILTKAEANWVVKIYNVSDRVLDAMYTLGQEDNKVSKSALNWAIDKVKNGDEEFFDSPSDRTAIVFWVQHIANQMVEKINPNFIGYVSHCDEDEVVDKIANLLSFRDKAGLERPSCKQILKEWIEEDWAPIYMYTKD